MATDRIKKITFATDDGGIEKMSKKSPFLAFSISFITFFLDDYLFCIKLL